MQHQTHTTTEFNRYPDIFAFVGANWPHLQNILSFGCSSGEECFSLRNYFPNASIFGLDRDQQVLSLAQSKNIDPAIFFTDSINAIPNVDAVFAMSVFCRHPESSELEHNHIYSFDDFSKGITLLDSKLNTNGLFVIFNSNYHFLDTSISQSYKPIQTDLRNEFVRKFDKNGDYTTAKSPLIYIKQ